MIGLEDLNPGFVLILGGLICALSPWLVLRQFVLVAAPAAAAALIMSASYGNHGMTEALRFNLILFRLD